jgi:DNA repair protein RadC
MNVVKKLQAKLDGSKFYVPVVSLLREGVVDFDILPHVSDSKSYHTHLRMYIDSDYKIKEQINLREMFFATYLNRKGKIIGFTTMFTGGIGATVVDIKLLWAIGLLLGASALIVTHNHPSGNVSPSQEDKNLANEMVKQAKILEMPMLDFSIISQNTYFSFADEGLI